MCCYIKGTVRIAPGCSISLHRSVQLFSNQAGSSSTNASSALGGIGVPSSSARGQHKRIDVTSYLQLRCIPLGLYVICSEKLFVASRKARLCCNWIAWWFLENPEFTITIVAELSQSARFIPTYQSCHRGHFFHYSILQGLIVVA